MCTVYRYLFLLDTSICSYVNEKAKLNDLSAGSQLFKHLFWIKKIICCSSVFLVSRRGAKTLSEHCPGILEQVTEPQMHIEGRNFPSVGSASSYVLLKSSFFFFFHSFWILPVVISVGYNIMVPFKVKKKKS